MAKRGKVWRAQPNWGPRGREAAVRYHPSKNESFYWKWRRMKRGSVCGPEEEEAAWTSLVTVKTTSH